MKSRIKNKKIKGWLESCKIYTEVYSFLIVLTLIHKNLPPFPPILLGSLKTVSKNTPNNLIEKVIQKGIAVGNTLDTINNKAINKNKYQKSCQD